ncbi:MAG: SGNH/GDSL hydrolase family protein [Pseudomonadota bacterium]
MKRWLILAAIIVLLPVALTGSWRAYKRLTTVNLTAPSPFSLALCDDSAARAGKTVVVTLGDSLTRGNMSHSYVADARERLGEPFLVLNPARNGLLIEEVHGQLDDVIACDPDIITILAGTNDALRADDFPRDWTQESARFRALLTRLTQETSARIAVFTLPFTGDHSNGGLNQRTASLSAELASVATEVGVTELPLRARQAALLDELAAPGPPLPVCDTLDDARQQMAEIVALVSRRNRSIDYDTLATERGHVLVIDCIHLSGVGAAPASELLVSFARGDVRRPSPDGAQP